MQQTKMPEAFREALDTPKPVIIDSKVEVPGLGIINVAHEPKVDIDTSALPSKEVTVEELKEIAENLPAQKTKSLTRRIKWNMAHNNAMFWTAPTNPEGNRATRRKKHKAFPKKVETITRSTDGARVKAPHGCSGAPHPERNRTVYAQNEAGMTRQDKDRKVNWINARARIVSKKAKKAKA